MSGDAYTAEQNSLQRLTARQVPFARVENALSDRQLDHDVLVVYGGRPVAALCDLAIDHPRQPNLSAYRGQELDRAVSSHHHVRSLSACSSGVLAYVMAP